MSTLSSESAEARVPESKSPGAVTLELVRAKAVVPKRRRKESRRMHKERQGDAKESVIEFGEWQTSATATTSFVGVNIASLRFVQDYSI